MPVFCNEDGIDKGYDLPIKTFKAVHMLTCPIFYHEQIQEVWVILNPYY